MKRPDLIACPLPLALAADRVPEIISAHEWASFQSEYGISMEKWLDDNSRQAREMLDRWWRDLLASQRREWITRYRKEVADEIERMKLDLTRLDHLLEKDDNYAPEDRPNRQGTTAEGPQTQVPG